MSKAQSDIIAAILIIVIALGLSATAYTWGIPLIQKRQDTAIVERMAGNFDQNNVNSLPSRIEFIANNGGEETFKLDVDGVWELHTCPTGELSGCTHNPDDSQNNFIQFASASRVTNIAASTQDWVSLTTGAACPPSKGIVGTDKSSVVCARADELSGGLFNISYRIWFRELEELGTARSFKIDLTKHTASDLGSIGKTVRISRENFHQISSGGKTLIIPEIKILLE